MSISLIVYWTRQPIKQIRYQYRCNQLPCHLPNSNKYICKPHSFFNLICNFFMNSILCLYRHPNRHASVRVSASQPQLGYSTNGGTAGGALINSGGGNDTNLRKDVISSITGNTSNNNGSNSTLLSKQHGGTCEQSTQTPESLMRETRRHKLKAFKFSLNNVTTPALNLRWALCMHAYSCLCD